MDKLDPTLAKMIKVAEYLDTLLEKLQSKNNQKGTLKNQK